ncbi:MAG TPA: hypothetical protein VMF87_21450 [Streptosporangiaceae bacterium]|jgi:hypothetical protein|nr:hypothetical protein [Streptosporangiaceae bacterium]
MPDGNVYHTDGGRFVAPGDPIMDRKGDMATFIGLTRREASEPVLVAVHWTDQPECVTECRPSLFNLHVG